MKGYYGEKNYLDMFFEGLIIVELKEGICASLTFAIIIV